MKNTQMKITIVLAILNIIEPLQNDSKSDISNESEQTEEEKAIIQYEVQYREEHRNYQDKARKTVKELEEKISMVKLPTHP